MSDIFQEVEQDLRRERLKKAWDRYGIFVIGTAVLIVLITAGYRGYEAWSTNRDRSAGDRFSAILQQAQDARTVTAAEQLGAFAEDAPAGYAMLADFRAATVYEQAGEPERAREMFAALAQDSSNPPLYRELAQLRLGQTLIDLGEYDEARRTLSAMAEDSGNPFTSSAQELMGLAAYAAGDTSAAQRWYTSVRDAAGAPQGLKARARFMLALITQSTAQDESAASDAAQETN